MMRRISDIPGELMLGLDPEQLDARPAIEEFGVGMRDQGERPDARCRVPGRPPRVHSLQIAWVRLLTVSLITTFRSALRIVVLVMIGFAETVMIAPLPLRLLGPGRERHRDPDQVQAIARPSARSSPALIRRNWLRWFR